MVFLILITLILSVALSSCPQTGLWEETPPGQVATVSCNTLFGVTYYEGNLTRTCLVSPADEWGVVHNACVFIAPSAIVYPTSPYYEVGSSIHMEPSYNGYVESWTIFPPLPSSILWNSQTGAINGLVESEMDQVYTITASNQDNNTTVTLTLTFVFVGCPTDGVWPATPAGQTCKVTCTDEFMYLGSRSRTCKEDPSPQWGEVVDECVLGPPYNLTYPYSTLYVYGGYSLPTMIPSYRGKGVSFFSNTSFPAGVSLNPKTGGITSKGSVEKEECSFISIGLRNEIGNCSTVLTICTIPKEGKPETKLGNQPKRLFWYVMTAGVIILTPSIMLSIPYCICQSRKESK